MDTPLLHLLHHFDLNSELEVLLGSPRPAQKFTRISPTKSFWSKYFSKIFTKTTNFIENFKPMISNKITTTRYELIIVKRILFLTKQKARCLSETDTTKQTGILIFMKKNMPLFQTKYFSNLELIYFHFLCTLWGNKKRNFIFTYYNKKIFVFKFTFQSNISTICRDCLVFVFVLYFNFQWWLINGP